jgi:glycerophosphoryl diester phosphodiesterase
MKVIAHRGANREALENSRAAYDLSLAGGATRIELDVQLSADGHAVINHDDELGHTVAGTHRGRKISTMTRRDLGNVRLSNGEPLPFLDDIVDEFADRIELNIEIKGRSTQLAEGVARTCNQHGRLDAFVISSFESEPLVYLKDHHPRIARACLWGSDNLSGMNFSRFAPPVFMAMAGAQIFHPVADWIDERLMDQAKARGWKVYGWVPMAGETNGRESLWNYLATLEVDGLCTNYPREMKEWIRGVEHDGKRINQLSRNFVR